MGFVMNHGLVCLMSLMAIAGQSMVRGQANPGMHVGAYVSTSDLKFGESLIVVVEVTNGSEKNVMLRPGADVRRVVLSSRETAGPQSNEAPIDSGGLRLRIDCTVPERSPLDVTQTAQGSGDGV
jgi:hypothetical protein